MKKGFKDGIPIGLGYFSVSFTFGMMATRAGFPVWVAVLISMTNLTSAGQFAGLTIISSGGSLIELALSQIIINLRYSLMSISLTQKIDTSFTLKDRLLVSFGNTDEIFAVASSQKGLVNRIYMYGLMIAPYIGWTLGTLVGATASSFLMPNIQSALGIMIYGMFIAIIIPPAKENKSILFSILISISISLILHFVPMLSFISDGFIIIISAVAASALLAYLKPVKEVD